MEVKDYYSILELAPGASPDDIKSAYRRLAMQFHPDKTNNDAYAAAHFSAVKEAYETLSNPARKEHYLQLRWYAQSTGRKLTPAGGNPETILTQWLELDKYVHKLDVFRLDHHGLHDYMKHLLREQNIERLNGVGELSINATIVKLAATCAAMLPAQLLRDIVPCIQSIRISDDRLTQMVSGLIRVRQREEQLERWRPWLILITALLLCVVIFLLTRRVS